jgi:alkylhydroperoxidase family enzyme
MTYVRIIPAEEATGDLASAYERVDVTEGPIGPPYAGMTNNGATLLKLMQFTTEARFGPSSLDRLRQEMVATYVSAINHCVF